ncbi:hypothetical protein DFJ74DRAFT_363655 [Hyaloraphidium curvatum]|nr:hypothetical protein DFJ74DRAFT_363655 [Hyaloraphidium curvatum]
MDCKRNPKDTSPKRSQRHRSRATALCRAAGAVVTAGTLLAAMLDLPAQAGATSSGYVLTKEVVDPATGFLVCRTESPGLASQCVGWCDGGPFANYGRRRLAARSQWGFACGKYNGDGSCVRAPSLGCLWIRAGFRSDASKYSSGGEYPLHVRCTGPSDGECSLFSDPFCTQAQNGDPVAGGGALCNGKSVNVNEAHYGYEWKEDYSFCGEASSSVVSDLLYPKKPDACPDVTETSSNDTFFGPWIAIRSCEDKGNYLRVRRAGFGVMCHGPDWEGSRCSWYTEMSLSTLAPGEPEPNTYGDRAAGFTCKQTELGWCKLAADAVLRGIAPNYECPGIASPMTPTRTATTTTPGPVRTVSPRSDWHCLHNVICDGYVKGRLVDADGRNTLQCRGPDAGNCWSYKDGNCTIQVAWPFVCRRADARGCGRAAPAREDGSGGAVCSPTELAGGTACVCPCTEAWCARLLRSFSEHPDWDYANDQSTTTEMSTKARSQAAAATIVQGQGTSTTQAPVTPTPTTSSWICIRSCADKGNFVAVRAAGPVAQCRGPDTQRCSWYSDQACAMLAPGEPKPSAEGGGMVCPERADGWCARAFGVLSGEQSAVPQCPTSSGATVASPTRTTADTQGEGSLSGARSAGSVPPFALPVITVAILFLTAS